MADSLISVFSGLFKRLRDMGDNTVAEVVATAPAGIHTTVMLSAVTTAAAGSSVDGQAGMKTFHAKGATTGGTGSVTVNVEGSMTGTNWDVIGTITLTLGTSATSDGFASNDRYALLRGNVTAISGTGANVTLTMGY